MQERSKYLVIGNETRIIDIQNAFTSSYPFLSIELSCISKSIFSFKKHNVEPGSRVDQFGHLVQPVCIDINEERTIAEIERDFIELIGLKLKVFRKSGKTWNEISLTDSWTLKSQNKAGEFISMEMAAAS